MGDDDGDCDASSAVHELQRTHLVVNQAGTIDEVLECVRCGVVVYEARDDVARPPL